MIPINPDNYTKLYVSDAAKLLNDLIRRPQSRGAHGRTPVQTAALAMGFASMQRHGYTGGVNEKYLSIISYLTRNPSAIILPDETVLAALNVAASCLEADVTAERIAAREFARRY